MDLAVPILGVALVLTCWARRRARVRRRAMAAEAAEPLQARLARAQAARAGRVHP